MHVNPTKFHTFTDMQGCKAVAVVRLETAQQHNIIRHVTYNQETGD
ncbi:predicted protein [Sclerotinia sclerotiorum 1980 UF-70]|uniref:Uncharacterized protein n=1 Tax=Sclerotinia sclerotiorum (strain ATCC 18683 / 1980 / Ss-1) TaxID=665079 RepID=A7EJI3_SCLS1|nr:predicted protein [Sclerotinia sclerotiorum 1980 UF-70]EDO02999.1 predicted protein [Sclerotinia sclerotiorum 1980 UF-70]